jgi:hypothetical protein
MTKTLLREGEWSRIEYIRTFRCFHYEDINAKRDEEGIEYIRTSVCFHYEEDGMQIEMKGEIFISPPST